MDSQNTNEWIDTNILTDNLWNNKNIQECENDDIDMEVNKVFSTIDQFNNMDDIDTNLTSQHKNQINDETQLDGSDDEIVKQQYIKKTPKKPRMELKGKIKTIICIRMLSLYPLKIHWNFPI